MQAWFAVNPTEPYTLQKVWHRALGKLRVKRMSIRRKNLLTRVSVGYVLRIYSFRDMMAIGKMLRIPVDKWRILRHALLEDFHTVLGIKLMLVRCQTKRITNKPIKLRSEIKQAGLLLNDRALFRHLADMNLDKLLTMRLRMLPVEKVPTVPQVINECGAFLADRSVRDWIGKFVNRKMRFMFSSQNYTADDYISELKMKAVATFFFLTPFQENLHRRNTVKRAIHNHGIFMMGDYNKDNPRLWFNGEQWENLVQVFSDNVSTDNEQQLSTANVGIGLNQFARAEHGLAIDSYLRNRSKLHKSVMDLLSMKYDVGFQKYLQRKTGGKAIDNETAFTKFGRDWYFTHVAKYLHVTPAVVWSIVHDMREMLSG